jgi:hypothetical protein
MASRTIILLEDDVDGSRPTRPLNLAVKGFRCYAVMRTSESSSPHRTADRGGHANSGASSWTQLRLSIDLMRVLGPDSSNEEAGGRS